VGVRGGREGGREGGGREGGRVAFITASGVWKDNAADEPEE